MDAHGTRRLVTTKESAARPLPVCLPAVPTPVTGRRPAVTPTLPLRLHPEGLRKSGACEPPRVPQPVYWDVAGAQARLASSRRCGDGGGEAGWGCWMKLHHQSEQKTSHVFHQQFRRGGPPSGSPTGSEVLV